MLTGKTFTISRATVVLESINGTRSLANIPQGAIIEVTSRPTGPGMGTVAVLWDDRTFAMVTVDIEKRGTEIADPTGQSAGA
jgi:hypothetical protein